MIINHGRQAGASIAHPHGQLLGIPFVPRELADEQAGFDRFAGVASSVRGRGLRGAVELPDVEATTTP